MLTKIKELIVFLNKHLDLKECTKISYNEYKIIDMVFDNNLCTHIPVKDPPYFYVEIKNRLLLLKYRNDLEKIFGNGYFSLGRSLYWEPNDNNIRPKRWQNISRDLYVYKIMNEKRDDYSHNIIICESRDLRADRCIFELLEDANSSFCDGSFTWISTGFIISTHHKEYLPEIKEIFKDCMIEDRSFKDYYSLAIHFPDRVID